MPPDELMFDKSEIIVGLEVGTSKVCAVVGELDDKGVLNIVGIGTTSSRESVRKGEIINADLAEETIRETLAKAEEYSNVEIGSVYLGITGAHISGFNNRGVHPIASVDREIAEDDIRKVVRNARPQLPPDYSVLHTIRQHFRVDGQEDVESPVGRLASRLEVDVHVVCGQATRIQNPERVVNGLGIKVEDVAFNGRVGALAAVTPQLGKQGVILIDLGAGTTEYAAYLDGSLRHSGVLGVGGEHVSNDIGVGLKLSRGRAEKLKLEYGSAVPNLRVMDRMVNFSSDVGLDDKSVNLGHLHKIMNARLDELFRLIRNDLLKNGLLKSISGGVLLAGGGARTPQIKMLASQIFEMDVVAGQEFSENGPQDILNQPEYVTAIGLVKYGAQQVSQRGKNARGLMSWFVCR
jgi:cell division protein FtsA